MKQVERILTASNIEAITNEFLSSLNSIGTSLDGKRGIALFSALKREKTNVGPYPHVSLFEAANRIMSDIVILLGVDGLLKNPLFPFQSYTVEFGNEDKNGFDIRASSGEFSLVGEAFNVAPSFFQGKKSSVLKKLHTNGINATHRLLMFNDDAVAANYTPKAEPGLHHVIVGIDSRLVKIISCETNC